MICRVSSAMICAPAYGYGRQRWITNIAMQSTRSSGRRSIALACEVEPCPYSSTLLLSRGLP